MRAAPAGVRDKLKLGPQEALEVTGDANGLKAGDLILGVDGKKFKSFAIWNEMLRTQTDGPSAKLTILRDGKEQAVQVKVVPKPADETDKYATLYDEVLSNGHRIRTFVTKPKTPGKHPVLFWIQGINASTIDFPLATKNYMMPVIKSFAEDGYVTVRVEKPGVGDSEGGPARLVGYDEELDIYRQALKALDRYDFVDRANVFIFGHSMGGCHAPLVVSEIWGGTPQPREIPVKGIISYGTVANSWLEWTIRSPRVQSLLAGKTHGEIDTEVRQITQLYTYLYNEKRSIEWIKTNHPELKEIAEATSPDGVMLGDRSIRYMQEVNDHNFGAAWAKLGATKVLALFGESDWVSLREDQVVVAEAVNAAHPGNAEFKVVPQADHLFNLTSSMKDSFAHFNAPGSVHNTAVEETVKAWIASLR
jgi:pimeloyl-ACP methyl ester carboxylesterase